jgi:hypothetical protein
VRLYICKRNVKAYYLKRRPAIIKIENTAYQTIHFMNVFYNHLGRRKINVNTEFKKNRKFVYKIKD